MAGRKLIIRNAVAGDAVAMAEVERQSWPAALAATAPQFRDRINAYREGQLVADKDGRILGLATAQRITEAFLNANSDSYDLITDRGRFTNSHHVNGEIYQLIGVGVLPQFQGQQLGRVLVDRQIEFARSLPDVRRIVGFTRPVLFHRYQELPIEEYVSKRGDEGSLLDPVLAFHLEAGAKLVSIHPEFRTDDQEAGRYGILIEYTLSSETEGEPR